jgi:hypothetical protein
MDNEERILNKLDQMDERAVNTLVTVTEIKGEIRDLPDIKARVASLEKWKWGTIGALAASGSSLATTIIKAIGG